MHYTVKLIVQADDREKALANAESYAESLCNSGGPFDSYDMNGGWGKSEAVALSSKRGKKLLTEGMNSSRREFDEALGCVKYMLEHFTDDQIYEDNYKSLDDVEKPKGIGYLDRWQFGRITGHGDSSYVYAEGSIWGGPIKNQTDLRNATAGETNLWIVQVDFHN